MDTEEIEKRMVDSVTDKVYKITAELTFYIKKYNFSKEDDPEKDAKGVLNALYTCGVSELSVHGSLAYPAMEFKDSELVWERKEN